MKPVVLDSGVLLARQLALRARREHTALQLVQPRKPSVCHVPLVLILLGAGL